MAHLATVPFKNFANLHRLLSVNKDKDIIPQICGTNKYLGVVMWEKLKQLLVEREMTIAELEHLSGIPRKSLENMKKHDPSFSKIEKIADVLNVSMDEFRRCQKD